MSVETRGPGAARTPRRTSPTSNKPASRAANDAKAAAKRAASATLKAIESIERGAPPEHDHEAAYIDQAIPHKKLNMQDVEYAASAVFHAHEALKGLNDALYQAGRGKHIGCLKMYCLLDLLDRELYGALDLLRAFTPLRPDEG